MNDRQAGHLAECWLISMYAAPATDVASITEYARRVDVALRDALANLDGELLGVRVRLSH